MHPHAYKCARKFVEKYLNGMANDQLNVLDVGSLDVNGTLKPLFAVNNNWKYTGMDLQAGNNVDIVLEDMHKYPFQDSCFDVIVSTTVLEHDPMFWISFQEMVRVTKSKGYIYLCTPSAGRVHRYPLDCWRFYPDAYKALSMWCPSATLVQAYVSEKEPWKDNVGIFLVEK